MCASICLGMYVCICLSTYLSIPYPVIYLCIYLQIHHLSFAPPSLSSLSVFIYLSIYCISLLSVCLNIYQLSIHPSVHPSIISIHPSMHLPLYVSTYLSIIYFSLPSLPPSLPSVFPSFPPSSTTPFFCFFPCNLVLFLICLHRFGQKKQRQVL